MPFPPTPNPLWRWLSPEKQEELLRLQQGLPPAPPSQIRVTELAPPTPGSPLAPPATLPSAPAPTAPTTGPAASPGPGLLGVTPERYQEILAQLEKAYDPGALRGPLTGDEQADVRRAGWAGVAQGAAQTRWNATPAQALANAFAGYSGGAYQGRADIREQRKEDAELTSKGLEARLKLDEHMRKQAGRAQMEALIASDPQLKALYAADPEGVSKALTEQMLQTKERYAIGRNGEVLDKYTGELKAGPGGIRPDTQLGKLYAELGAMAPDDPRRPAYLAAIQKEVTASGGSTTYRQLTPEELKAAGYREGAVVYRGTDGKDIVTQQAGDVKDDPKFKQSADLRNSFEALTKEARIIVPAFGKMESAFAQDSKSGDVAALFAFMKMLDPTSVVRESEFATAGQAGSLPDQVQAYWDKFTGQGRLTPAQRAEILSAGRSQLAPYKRAFDETAANYRALAERFGLKPEDVVPTLTWPEIAPRAPAAAAPPGTVPPPPPGFILGD
jgi:hypothetical protein